MATNSISEFQRGNLGIPIIGELWTKKISTEKEKATEASEVASRFPLVIRCMSRPLD